MGNGDEMLPSTAVTLDQTIKSHISDEKPQTKKEIKAREKRELELK